MYDRAGVSRDAYGQAGRGPALREAAAFYSYVYPVDGVVGRQDHRFRWSEGDAYDCGAGEEEFGFRVGSDADDASAAFERCGDVEVVLRVERHALRAAQAAVKNFDVAVGTDALNSIEARRVGAGYVEILIGTEGEVVGGNRR